MTGDGARIEAALKTFAKSVQSKLSALAVGEPEEQLRAPAETLLQAAGTALGKSVLAKGETLLPGRLGKPDYAVLVGGALTGYVELKAVGRGADPNAFTGRNKEQWRRFKSLPNLVYSDGNEWSLYRHGKRVGKIVRLRSDLVSDGDGAVDSGAAEDLAQLLAHFFSWNPIVPTSPRELAEVLAPVCRLLRDQVRDSLEQAGSPLISLATDWRSLLFPEADNAQFADAYAQTVTYALLLARAEGATSADPNTAAQTLGTSHGLLARALQVLTDPAVEDEIGSALALLCRMIEAVRPATLKGQQPDPWLYFYEDFLAAYDPKLRKNAGVYYTPVEVVRAQVRLADELLRSRLGKPGGFAESDVLTLDPGVGTGTYLLGTITHALEGVARTYGPGAVPGRATTLGETMHGFELLVGPYAVAQLRVSRELEAQGGTLPADGPKVFLTDTLEDPATQPSAPPLFHAPIAREHQRAQQVKEKEPILVCIGNPPYDRHDASSPLGGWIRYGDGGVPSPLEDFLGPAREVGHGVHLKNLFNLYVYFWRWAIWKVFEQASGSGPGIVTYISASSYLAGPGFVGMRERLRRECDEVWIIDLGGEGRGSRKDENVFAIQTPVAIAIAVRYGQADRNAQANVRYTRIQGSRREKLDALDNVTSFSDLSWESCPSGWQDPFRPVGVGPYFAWPALADLFPWQHSGAQIKRTWPIGPDPTTLQRRWDGLLNAPDRRVAFKETRDRKVAGQYHSPTARLPSGPPLDSLSPGDDCPRPVLYAYRSLDRQYLLADYRLADFPRPSIWASHSDKQLYLTTLMSQPLGRGPAVFAACEVPDLDHFSGRGAKDVMPLWRNPEGFEANVAPDLLNALSVRLGSHLRPEDLLAYVYGVLCSSAYAERFEVELEEPGPRVPLTLDPDLFAETVEIGEELLFLHTYGERYVTPPRARGIVRSGAARVTVPVSQDPEHYPREFVYDEQARELRVGDGVFASVAPEVWAYGVSGLRVIRSWLGYRMKERTGKRTPLDHVQPERWTTELTEELLRLVWIIERTVEIGQRQVDLLDRILPSDLLLAADLATSPRSVRAAPVFGGQDRLPSLEEPGDQPQLDQ